MANKSSAVADEPIEVLFALHPKFNIMDFAGPLEVLATALHDAQDPSELPIFVTRPRSLPWAVQGSMVPQSQTLAPQWPHKPTREL